MDCDRFTDEKVLLAHGEIGHVPEFDAHLASCAPCRGDVAEMRDVRRRYRASGAEAMPDRLRARLLAMRPRVTHAAWQRWVTAAAAAVLLGVLVVPMLRSGRLPDTPETKTWDLPAIEEVRERVRREEEPRRSAVPVRDIDRDLRELKRKIDIPKDDEW